MSYAPRKPPPGSLWDVPPVDPNAREQDRPALTGQNAEILALLRQGPVTITEAMAIGCTRLAARIHDLRAAGCVIDDAWMPGSRVKVYTLRNRG